MEFLDEIKTLQHAKHSLKKNQENKTTELMQHYDAVISHVHEVNSNLSRLTNRMVVS